MEHEAGQAPAPRMAVLAVSPYTLRSTPSSWPAPVPMTPLALPSLAKGGSGGDFKRTSESSWQKALPRPGTSVPTPPMRLGLGPQFQAYPDVNEPCQGLYQEVRRPFPPPPAPGLPEDGTELRPPPQPENPHQGPPVTRHTGQGRLGEESPPPDS